MQKPVIELDTTIAAASDVVWKAMTARWSALFPGTEVKTDWQVGHPITISGEWQGKAFTDHGEVSSFEEGKELSFSHWSGKDGETRPASYHVVRYRLEPEGDRTKVTLAQFNEGAKTDIDDRTKAEFTKNWRMMLDGLRKSVEHPR